MGEDLFFQFFDKESSTYTYLIADSKTLEAAIIDPVLENLQRDTSWIRELGLNLKYILDTHLHADHITAASELRRTLGAKTAISSDAEVSCADLALKDGDDLFLGTLPIKVLSTPGHTNSCLSFLFCGKVFTGDALLIRGTGRTDFQEGSADALFDSITHKLFSLPNNTLVYPAHDYQGQTKSTIGLEKAFNLRIGGGKSKSQFIEIMSNLKLSLPKNIHHALPANKACGQTQGLS